METKGASVVITQQIKAGKQSAYEAWLAEISTICKTAPGFVDWQIIRPIPNLTYTYTVIMRFSSIDYLRNWMESSERSRLIAKASPLFTHDDQYFIKSGLDFLFSPEHGKANAPVRWKQYAITLSAIYPIATVVPLLLHPLLRYLHIPENRYLDGFAASLLIVFLMVYVVMPHYTKLVRHWLYR
jgi:uncharacterized protein